MDILRHLRRTALRSGSGDLSDAQLVASFLAQREEAAFAALLRRHGPMVLGVCRRILRDAHDAEDAFQATFLVLVRKAGTLRSRELLGNWLYGVAYRTAMKARAMSAKRRRKESQAQPNNRSELPAQGPSEELLDRLDGELARLPDKYRAAVVLCELEGKTRKTAARMLGLTEGTLSWRLAQARKMLARRLGPYAGALSVGGLTTVLPQGAASASVPAALVTATARAALQVAAGQALGAGAVSIHVLTLTEGVVKAMFLSKVKVVGAVTLAISLAVGAAGWTYGQVAAEPRKPAATSPQGRRALDEVEALRLEVEALRKALDIVRGRVESLENEARASKPAPKATLTGALDSTIGLKDRRGLETELRPGMVAVAVRISAETGVGGFVIPGSHVNVVHQIRDNRGGEAKMLLENILVKAIDLNPVRPEDRPGMVGGTATLELTPQEALKLTAAQGSGTIYLQLLSGRRAKAPD